MAARFGPGNRGAATVGHCKACGVPMLSAYAWSNGTRREGHLKAGARGYCQTHYARLMRNGTTEKMPYTPRPKRGPVSRTMADTLEEYAIVRDDVDSVASAAKRMGMSWSALDAALRRARKAGLPGAEPPLSQIYRGMAS